MNRKIDPVEPKKEPVKILKQDSKRKNVAIVNSKLEKEIESLEKEIQKIEDELKKMDELISQLDFEKEESHLILNEYEKKKSTLDALIVSWEEKVIQLE
jgi:chromosome segregation ATPase